MAGLFSSGHAHGEPTHFARVAVERGIDRRGAALTYALGDEPVLVGERVEVPLGRGDKRAAGIVVTVGGRELLDGLDPDRVKRILRRTGSRLPEKLVELGAWMADYYICPVGMVLAAMTPAAVKHGTGRTTRAEIAFGPAGSGAVPPADLKPAPRAAWGALSALGPGVLPLAPRPLAARLGLKSIGPINRLVDAGLLRVAHREVVRVRDAAWDRVEVESRDHRPVTELSGPQRRATDGIAATLGGFAVHLIRGVTGSGKTEVYLRLIDRVLADGGTAIVLVPEIALTPQTAGRFLARFRDRGVAVLHSGLAAAHRHRQWAMASSGEARVIVGARSAVLAPVHNLGLIVVDEEHDSSGYKQEQLPRYHGRDVAIKRAQLEGCPIVLGSATPSLESWANATGPEARFRLWELPERVGPGKLPRVEIVDLAQERRVRSEQSGASTAHQFMMGPRLESALAATLSAGGQAILLLNRRGYSSYLACPDTRCGFVARCEHCDVAMVLHRAQDLPPGGLIRCHHCLAEQLVPRACPVCGRRPVPLGIGTQRVEEELGAVFGPSHGLVAGESMVRADGDTMRSARDYFRVLARFAAGSIKVLLGTQIISKGLDYPNVRLVGVINADTALALPDFRAAERTFQLVSQVAGRAGRGVDPGLVIVQTFNPTEPAIALAARHEYVAFADGELALRRAAGLPPATRMARIVVRDKDADAARDSAAELARLLRDAGGPIRMFGPAPCPISRIGGYHRVGIELIAPTASDLHRPLAAVRSAGLLKSDARTAVDVDPAGLM